MVLYLQIGMSLLEIFLLVGLLGYGLICKKKKMDKNLKTSFLLEASLFVNGMLLMVILIFVWLD